MQINAKEFYLHFCYVLFHCHKDYDIQEVQFDEMGIDCGEFNIGFALERFVLCGEI